MIIKQTRLEKLISDYCKPFAKGWDYYCVASDAYLAGYKQARNSAASIVFNQMGVSLWTEEDTIEEIKNMGTGNVQVEVKDGEHQLSINTFDKWSKEIRNMPFKEALDVMLSNYDFDDIRVEEKNGVISFQGTCKRND